MKILNVALSTSALLLLLNSDAMAQRNGILSGNSRNGVDVNLGQAIGNAIQNEIQGSAGVSNRTDVGVGNRGINNGQMRARGEQNIRGNVNGGIGGGRNGSVNNSANYNQSSARYRNNAIASVLLSQFPEASRILAPRGYGNRGAYYRNNDRYYYYPNAYSTNSGYQQSGTVYLQQNPSAGYSNAPTVQPVAIEFGGFVHTEEFGQLLPAVINDLCLDMHYNYSQNPTFAATYRDAYEMLNIAKSLQQALPSNNRDAVKQHLLAIDPLMHRVESQTIGWTRNHARQFGELGLVAKQEMVSDILHHMMYDAGHGQPGSPAAGDITGEVAPAPAGN